MSPGPRLPPVADTPPNWLDGVTVLDLTRYLAGPSCTRLLVELGADVIKVEQPPYGDANRSNRPRINHRAGAHVQQNRGKRSVCVDMKTDDGRRIIAELAATVDVVVENFTPGVLDRHGLGYDQLSAANPALVMASISGFGQTGPLAGQPCFDLIAQAYAGIMHMTGDPDGEPTFVGSGIADTNAGVHAFAAIGHALFHRERTGRGSHIDVAMVDSLYHFNEQAVHAPSMDPDYVAIRQGRHYGNVSPAGSFRGPEGWIIILCTQAQIDNLWRAMGTPELAADERFDTNPHRLEHRDELTALIEQWMATFSTDAEVMQALGDARVPHGPVLSPTAAAAHPHFIERGVVRTVHDPFIGDLQIPGFPFKASGLDPDPDLVAPGLGEHNEQVLTDVLGYDTPTIAGLVEQGVLFSKPY